MHGVYIPHSIYTSRMGTARMKWEEETDTRVMQESSKKYGRKERGHEGKSFKQNLTSAKDLTIDLPEGRESPYHRLD